MWIQLLGCPVAYPTTPSSLSSGCSERSDLPSQMEKTQSVATTENGGNQEQPKKGDGSICGYESLHQLLRENLRPDIFQVIVFVHLASLIICTDSVTEVFRLSMFAEMGCC